MRLVLLILWIRFWGSTAINLVNLEICQTIGGFYRNSSDSCFWLGKVKKNWHDSFDYCSSNDNVPFADYTGRLARIDTEELWADIATKTYPNKGFWIGNFVNCFTIYFTYCVYSQGIYKLIEPLHNI